MPSRRAFHSPSLINTLDPLYPQNRRSIQRALIFVPCSSHASFNQLLNRLARPFESPSLPFHGFVCCSFIRHWHSIGLHCQRFLRFFFAHTFFPSPPLLGFALAIVQVLALVDIRAYVT